MSVHEPFSCIYSTLLWFQEDLGEMSVFLQDKLNKPPEYREADDTATQLDDGRCVSVDKFELEIDRYETRK